MAVSEDADQDTVFFFFFLILIRKNAGKQKPEIHSWLQQHETASTRHFCVFFGCRVIKRCVRQPVTVIPQILWKKGRRSGTTLHPQTGARPE